jgi:RNA polymerase sigma-70 factor, ECF subfamily
VPRDSIVARLSIKRYAGPVMAFRPDPQHNAPSTELAARELREALEREWIARVRTGDAVAFEAMFRAYATPLAGFVFTFVRVSDEAQELVQDLFLWIWEHRFEWDVPGSLRTYLFKSARNRALSRLRHRRVEHEFQERMAREDIVGRAGRTHVETDQALATSELSSALERAVAGLPDRCREVFQLNRRQHLSYAEIADLLDISPKTVEVHMGRALAFLRRELGDWVAP